MTCAGIRSVTECRRAGNVHYTSFRRLHLRSSALEGWGYHLTIRPRWPSSHLINLLERWQRLPCLGTVNASHATHGADFDWGRKGSTAQLHHKHTHTHAHAHNCSVVRKEAKRRKRHLQGCSFWFDMYFSSFLRRISSAPYRPWVPLSTSRKYACRLFSTASFDLEAGIKGMQNYHKLCWRSSARHARATLTWASWCCGRERPGCVRAARDYVPRCPRVRYRCLPPGRTVADPRAVAHRRPVSLHLRDRRREDAMVNSRTEVWNESNETECWLAGTRSYSDEIVPRLAVICQTQSKLLLKSHIHFVLT